MQVIYTYIPEKNYVPREYSVAAILLLLSMVLMSLVSVLNLLYFYISTFRIMCAVPNMAVLCRLLLLLLLSSSSSSNFSLLSFGWEIFTYIVMQLSTGLGCVVLFVV